jgi:hypothetical protein
MGLMGLEKKIFENYSHIWDIAGTNTQYLGVKSGLNILKV